MLENVIGSGFQNHSSLINHQYCASLFFQIANVCLLQVTCGIGDALVI